MSIAVETPAGLVAGDRLSRDEFLRRWEAAPDVKKAELIGGVVYMPSPISVSHGTGHAAATTWLSTYAARTPGCEAGDNCTWYMLDDAPQPDAHLRIDERCGGLSRVEDDFLHGAPELIVEISRSSTSYDLHQKMDLYAAAGVPEYLVAILHERDVRWHRLVGCEYELIEPWSDGSLRSVVFPGLWLDPKALLAGDLAGVLATLDRGLKSDPHARFVTYLADKRISRGQNPR